MNARPRVLLVQLPIPPLGPQPIRGNVPLAAAYLQLYARQCGLEELFAIEILPAHDSNRLGDQALVDAICQRDPWMVGFTCYLWNIDRTLWVAEQIKRLRPSTLIALGGPEITRDNDWVLGSPCLDYAAIGEGERTFAELLACHAQAARQGSGPSLARQIREPLRSWLESTGDRGLAAVDGLAFRVGGRMLLNPPRTPMSNLDAISSPYLAGILNAGDQEQLLLETIRGCVFRCKFCYYPKAYDRLYYVSEERILANLAHAREHGAKEVYLLDPTLNQRRDFADFLRVLERGNPEGRLEYYAELRAEGVTAEHAKRMRQANFKEVEIGLQSINPKTQDLMDRHNNLKAFEKGVRALQAEGVKVKVDLIVGLPGDTVDSVRRGMQYLAENRLYDDIQVFQLSILPGTAFRSEAAQLGLRYQPRPPYYVLETPTLSLDDMLMLLEESEEVFETEFDRLPPPETSPCGLLQLGPSTLKGSTDALGVCPGVIIDLDRLDPADLPTHSNLAFTLWFRTTDPYSRLSQAKRIVREFLDTNPFSTLEIVVETGAPFPFDVFKGLQAACVRPENIYLDRFYEFTPGTTAAARRIVVVMPAENQHRIDPTWINDAREFCELVVSPPPRGVG